MADGKPERQRDVLVRGFDPLAERGIEAMFRVANGFFGVRGALEEGNPASNPRLLVAGVYTEHADPAGPTLLAFPDPSAVRISIDGEQLDLDSVHTLLHERRLDIDTAELRRDWQFSDSRERGWRLTSQRAASASHATAYLHRLVLILERGPTALVRIATPVPEGCQFAQAVFDGHVEVALSLEASGTHLATLRRITAREVGLDDRRAAVISVAAGEDITIETTVHVTAPGQPGPSRVQSGDLWAFHQSAWKPRWAAARVAVDGDDGWQEALDLSMYHLLSSAAETRGQASIPARDLSGEAYRGHVFWDAELFALPTLTHTWPEAARSCLIYRHRTLPAALARARARGYEGALYAWESADTGEDVTPESARDQHGRIVPILNGEQEHHVSSAVPFAAVRYWRATGDNAFMRDYGAEILIECARFWASRASPQDSTYAVRNVIGPDEFHVGVDNNAYTNAMASWVLNSAAEYVEVAPGLNRDERNRYRLRTDETAEWQRIAGAIVRSGGYESEMIVEQFDGFFGLEDVDVTAYRRAGIPLDIALGGPEVVVRYRAAKQADVLMLACLMPELWSEGSLRRNFDYYEPITAHTSSLSPPMHALVAALLRDEERCLEFLDETARIDTSHDYRPAAGGTHIAAMGGLWQAVVFGLGGFRFDDRSVSFDPWLPRPITSLSFTVRWRGRRLAARVDAGGTIEITNDGEPCAVRVNQLQQVVGSGERMAFPFSPSWTFWSPRGDVSI
jgi:kojibiose phosphorylase